MLQWHPSPLVVFLFPGQALGMRHRVLSGDIGSLTVFAVHQARYYPSASP